MIARLLVLLGAILIVLGVLKFIGVLAFAAAGAVTLIVVGIILALVGYYVFGGWGGRTGGPVV